MSEFETISRELGERVERAQSSVVKVHAPRGGGSGLVWSERIVVTAAHNLTREDGIEVSIGTERHPVTLLGVDPATDVAALRVEVDLVPWSRADAAALRAGELVVGVGRSPDGVRAHLGMLVSLGGSYRLPGGNSVDRYVESDLRIAPGFSGSALMSAAGELIGMNTVGIVRGTAIALPAVTLGRVIDALAQHGRVRRSYLGVSVQSARLPQALATEVGQRNGLLVFGVEPGGPAETAGVLMGDVLLRFGSEKLSRVGELEAALPAGVAGVETELRLWRAGAEQKLRVAPRIRA